MATNKDVPSESGLTDKNSLDMLPEISSENNSDYESGERESCENDIKTHETHEIHEITKITDISTWSELSKYITAYHPSVFDDDEMASYVDIYLTCDICQDKHLRLPGWVDLTGYLSEDWDNEHLCVLPCGHFFGHHCIKKWVDQKREDNATPDCPKCRFGLLYPECGHQIKLKALRDMNDFDPDDMPILVPNTRIHVFGDDGKTFVDVSTQDPKESDAEHNFGVHDNCAQCEKRKMIEAWEEERRMNPKW